MATLQFKEDRRTLIAASFSNGFLLPSSRDTVDSGYYDSTETKDQCKKHQRILVGEANKMTYLGQNFGAQASRQTSFSKYYIGVLNRKSHKMRVCDAAMYTLSPHFADSTIDNSADTPSDLSYMEKKDQLVSAFGSAKRKRAMESRLKHEIKGETLTTAIYSAVDHALLQEHTNVDTTPQRPQTAAASAIPPYDVDATQPADIYKLSGIISQDIMNSLAVPGKTFFDCNRTKVHEWTTKHEYPVYITKHLAFLPIAEASRWHKAKCLLFLHYMMHLYRLGASALKQKDPMPESCPDVVKKSLFSSFTIMAGTPGRKNVRCMPIRLKDKLLSYMIVLALIIDEFSLEFTDLQKDLQVGAQRLQTFCRALGCKVSSHKVDTGLKSKVDVKTVTLKAPLVFPEQTVKKTGKARR